MNFLASEFWVADIWVIYISLFNMREALRINHSKGQS
jgi:hypothetical protein